MHTHACTSINPIHITKLGLFKTIDIVSVVISPSAPLEGHLVLSPASSPQIPYKKNCGIETGNGPGITSEVSHA